MFQIEFSETWINRQDHVLYATTRTYSYNFRHQMTSLVDTNGTTYSFTFDGFGNRTKQQTSGSCALTSYYVYDGSDVVLELNASNQVVHAYVGGLGIDDPIERIAYVNNQPTTRLVYHPDALGSIAAMTDASQNTVKSYAYEAFGKVRAETGGVVQDRYTYTGREMLPDVQGFYYYRYRVLDPNTGRFTSEDPLGFVDGPNVYVYVGNSSLNYVDPEGLGKVGFCVKTAKGLWKKVNKDAARKALQKKRDVRVVGKGSSKDAKNLAREQFGDKTVRHDPHQPGQKPHYQHKSGGRGHVQYLSLSAISGGLATKTATGRLGEGALSSAIDFVNPFADAKDIVDLLGDFQEPECEEECPE